MRLSRPAVREEDQQNVPKHPKDERSNLYIFPAQAVPFSFALRLPNWVDAAIRRRRNIRVKAF